MFFFKKLFFLIFILCFSATFVKAVEIDEHYLEAGNNYYQEYLANHNTDLLEEAYLNYYKASEIKPTASAFLGMGMVFIEKGKMKQAKQFLYKAFSADANDVITNYYLAKFYFHEENYLRALYFYKQSYENGLAENYDVNLKLAIIYEKVGDIELAKKYYNAACMLNPQDEYAYTRLSLIEYYETQLENTEN